MHLGRRANNSAVFQSDFILKIGEIFLAEHFLKGNAWLLFLVVGLGGRIAAPRNTTELLLAFSRGIIQQIVAYISRRALIPVVISSCWFVPAVKILIFDLLCIWFRFRSR